MNHIRIVIEAQQYPITINIHRRMLVIKYWYKESPPKLFNPTTTLNVLKAYLENDECEFKRSLKAAFDWNSTAHEFKYWDERCNDMSMFNYEDYLELQHWINEFKNKNTKSN